jgi:hypothetical protein
MSLLVFNFFNFRTKAKCFAGDVGAISIAFVIVFMLCLYQLMANELKIPHVVVSSIYMVLQTLIVFGLIRTQYHYEYATAIIIFLSGIYVMFMKKFFRLHRCEG